MKSGGIFDSYYLVNIETLRPQFFCVSSYHQLGQIDVSDRPFVSKNYFCRILADVWSI
jgi:hypothetical protein